MRQKYPDWLTSQDEELYAMRQQFPLYQRKLFLLWLKSRHFIPFRPAKVSALFLPPAEAIKITYPYYQFFVAPLGILLLALSRSDSALSFIIHIPLYASIPVLVLLALAAIINPHEEIQAPPTTRAAFTLNVITAFPLGLLVTLAPTSANSPLTALLGLTSLTLFAFFLVAYTHLVIALTTLSLSVISPRFT